MKGAHDGAEAVLNESPRLPGMAFVGTMILFYLPLPAAGSIGRPFVGRLGGRSRGATVLAGVLGGALVSATFAYLAATIGAKAEAMAQQPWVVGAAIAAFLVFLWLAWRSVKQSLRS